MVGTVLGAVAGPLIGAFGGGGSSNQPGPAAQNLAGQATYSPPVSQTQPGGFSPPTGTGIAYNYIPTGGNQVDPALIQQIMTSLGTSGDFRNQVDNQLGAVNQTAPGLNAGAQQAGNWLTALGGAQALDSGNLRGAAYAQLPWTAALQGVGSGQQAVGAGLQTQGNQFNQSVLASLPQFQQVLAQGLDPQQALYNRTQQQNSEQVNAQLARMGLGQSGAGAGIANQANSNFNIDWQNQQLARALQGLQGFSSAMTGAGGQLQSGANVGGVGGNLVQSGANQIGQGQTMLGNAITQAGQTYNQGQQGAQNLFTGGALPFQTAVQSSAVPASIYQAYLGGTDPTLARAMQYLQQITNGSQVANQAASAQVGANTQQNAYAQSSLAPLIQSGLNGVGTWLNGLTSSGLNSGQQSNVNNLSGSDLSFLTGQGSY